MYHFLFHLLICEALINKQDRPIKTKGDIQKLQVEEFPYDIEEVATNLSAPWAMDVDSEGNVYFTERSGRIRIIENGVLREEPIYMFQLPF